MADGTIKATSKKNPVQRLSFSWNLALRYTWIHGHNDIHYEIIGVQIFHLKIVCI